MNKNNETDINKQAREDKDANLIINLFGWLTETHNEAADMKSAAIRGIELCHKLWMPKDSRAIDSKESPAANFGEYVRIISR